MKLINTIEALPPTHKALAVLVSTLIAGTFIGASLMGLSAIPEIAAEGQRVNIRQEITLDSLRQRVNQLDERLDRVTCLMVAQYENTNPLLCDSKRGY